MALNPKQRLFCQEYIKDLNGTQAAIRAGYSQKSAYAIASENLRKKEIRKYIDAYLQEKALSAEETTKLINDIARASINDYLISEMVEHTPRIKKPLKDIITEKRDAIQFEEEYAKAAALSKDEKKLHDKRMKNQRREVLRLELELRKNPTATRIVDGPTELVETKVLDLKRLAEDKQHGRIKTLRNTKYGVEVELYPANEALTNLAKIHGLFEKDNEQQAAKIIVTRK